MHGQLATGSSTISLPDPSRRMWARKWPRGQSPCATSDRSLNKVSAAPINQTEDLHKPYFNCILHDRPRVAYFSLNLCSPLTCILIPLPCNFNDTQLPLEIYIYSSFSMSFLLYVSDSVSLAFFLSSQLYLAEMSLWSSFLRHASHGPWNSKKEIKNQQLITTQYECNLYLGDRSCFTPNQRVCY